MSTPSDATAPLAIGVDFGGTTIKIGLVQGGALVGRTLPIPTLDLTTVDELMETI